MFSANLKMNKRIQEAISDWKRTQNPVEKGIESLNAELKKQWQTLSDEASDQDQLTSAKQVLPQTQSGEFIGCFFLNIHFPVVNNYILKSLIKKNV